MLLWEEAVELTKVRPSRGRRRQVEEATQQERNVERAITLAQDAQYARACQALSSPGMAPDSRACREALQAKPPAATVAPADPAPTTDFPQLSFSQVEVEKAVAF